MGLTILLVDGRNLSGQGTGSYDAADRNAAWHRYGVYSK